MPATPDTAPRALVLDTNVALDLLVFEDPTAAPLRHALAEGRLRWLVLAPMRAEFARVLDYPRVAAWRALRGRSAEAALAAFDAASRCVAAVAPAVVRCRDPDDQPFIDLAVAYRAVLLSKDRDVLATQARLRGHSVEVLKRLLTKGHRGACGD